MPSSFRDILIDRGRGSGWSTKHGSFNIFNRDNRYIPSKTSRITNIKVRYDKPISNKMPIYEMISGASIALAAFLLIVPVLY